MRRDRWFIGLGLVSAALGWTGQAFASDVLITPATTYQTIDGFGASSAWTAPTMTDDEADRVFLAENPDGGPAGVGLSLLRIHITPQGSTAELDTAQKAYARGVKVWATPWSPPSAWKENTDDAGNGGDLLPEHYGEWASILAQFCQSMQDGGVPLTAISAQNEPTYAAVNTPTTHGYESCVYTPAELADFIGQNLGPALADAGVTPPYGIVAPETEGWDAFPSYGQAIHDDPAAASYVGIYATHEYLGSAAAYSFVGNHFWETEIYDPNRPADPGMSSGIWTAEEMQEALTVAGVNAWHYWWIQPGASDDEGLYFWQRASSDAGPWGGILMPSKRLYVMGNFSRFVRPGYTRVDATPAAILPAASADGLHVTAYCSQIPCDGSQPAKLVIVAINGGDSGVNETFRMNGVASASWLSWVTSASLDLMPGDAVTETSSVTVTLPPMSVTTLVGSVTGVGAAQTLPEAGSSGASANDANDVPSLGTNGCACTTAVRGNGRGATPGVAAIFVVAAAAVRARRRRAPRVTVP